MRTSFGSQGLTAEKLFSSVLGVHKEVVMKTHLGRYLRACRNEEGRSLRSLADEIGLSDVFLSQVERGKKRLDRSHWAVIAEAIDCLDLDEMETRAQLDETMELDLEEDADPGLALELARRMTTTTLTDEKMNRLIALLSGRE